MKRVALAALVLWTVVLVGHVNAQSVEDTCDVVIKASALRVRTGPGEAYDSIGSVSAGQTITIIGRNAEMTWGRLWFLGEAGWLSLAPSFVDIPQDCKLSRLPEVAVAPPPAGERADNGESFSETTQAAPTQTVATSTAIPAASPTVRQSQDEGQMLSPLTATPATDTPSTPESATSPRADSVTREAPSMPGPSPFVLLGGIVGALAGAMFFIMLLSIRRTKTREASYDAELPAADVAETSAASSSAAVTPQDDISDGQQADAVEVEAERVTEVALDATLADLLSTDNLPAPTVDGIPSVSDDKELLFGLYLKACREPGRYVAVENLVQAGQEMGRVLSESLVLATALRLRRINPVAIKLGQYEDGRYAIKIYKHLLAPYEHLTEYDHEDQENDPYNDTLFF